VRGDNAVLAVTTTKDPMTGERKPLFAFPVQIVKAVETKEVKFDIAAPSGAARKQLYADSVTGEIIENADCLHGIRVGDAFKAIDEDAIAAINAATKIDTMIVSGTIDYNAIPFDRATDLFYIQSPAKGGSAKSYKLLYEALREVPKGAAKRPAKALVTKRTVRSKQQLLVIYADEDRQVLAATALRFAASVREPDELLLAPQIAQIEQAQIDMARTVLDGLGDGADALARETDEAQALKADLIEQALAGETLDIPTPIAETSKTDDLSALLEQSLAAVAG
jgi:non-homologous end joining protein Ku